MNNENLFDANDITVQMPNQILAENVVKIAVIGVGGGGGNMINHMISEGIHKIDLIVANTDLQVLLTSRAPKKIQLGQELTKGLGAGMKPEVGRDAAIESYEDIKEAVKHANIVFISAGLGGGTGTGAAAVVAKASKEMGALTVSVVTKPFSWEGKKKAGLANIGLEELRKVSDSIIVIPNDRVLDMIDTSVGMKEAFKMVDNVLFQAVNGVSEVILNPGDSDINSDFADIRTIMQHKGMALMGIGYGKGENAASEALEKAIDSPLLDKVSLSGARGILIHFNTHPEVSMLAISDIMTKIHDINDNEADIKMATTTTNSLERDEIKITIVATGFEAQNQYDENNEDENTSNLGKNNLDNEDTLDIPPLMRNYQIQYRLK